jgi:hypothetical protein
VIKVELIDDEKAKRRYVFFEATKEEDRETLDKILEALVGVYPKRGGFVFGAPNPTLKVEINLAE